MNFNLNLQSKSKDLRRDLARTEFDIFFNAHIEMISQPVCLFLHRGSINKYHNSIKFKTNGNRVFGLACTEYGLKTWKIEYEI